MNLLQIGDRIINIEAITHATREAEEVVISFGNDDLQVFFGGEADIAWSFITSHAYQLLPEGASLQAVRPANKKGTCP